MNTLEREIPREVNPPALSHVVVGHLTDLCFGPQRQSEDQCDALLVFGSANEAVVLQIVEAFSLACKIFSPRMVYITGGETAPGIIESHNILKHIRRQGYDDNKMEFVCDDVSMNTLQNVRCAVELGLDCHSSVAFLAKAQHCGRCELTLRNHLPQASIRRYGYNQCIPEHGLSIRRDWFASEVGRRLIWAEFLRIEKYGLRGDIYYPPEIAKKVQLIHDLTNT